MKPSQYNQFYDKLLANNIELIIAPGEYEQMHIFPNAYKFFGDDTAFMKVYPLHEQIEISDVKKHFNRFLVKDFVKSVKGTEFPKYFDVSITQEEFDNWIEVFYKYRGNLLTGGICIKKFLSLKFYGERPNEYRVFYANGEIYLFRCDGQYEVVGDSLWESIEICMGVANSSHGGEILWIKNE